VGLQACATTPNRTFLFKILSSFRPLKIGHFQRWPSSSVVANIFIVYKAFNTHNTYLTFTECLLGTSHFFFFFFFGLQKFIENLGLIFYPRVSLQLPFKGWAACFLLPYKPLQFSGWQCIYLHFSNYDFYVLQAGLELMILLPHNPSRWDYKCIPPQPISTLNS
jgi:hypothetical protein